MLICKPKHETYEVKFRFVWNHDENVFFGRVTANQMASRKAAEGGLTSLKRCSIGVENERSLTLKNKTHWRWSANDKAQERCCFMVHRLTFCLNTRRNVKPKIYKLKSKRMEKEKTLLGCRYRIMTVAALSALSFFGSFTCNGRHFRSWSLGNCAAKQGESNRKDCWCWR